jgi:uncharacterized surface protein with fasciclin (FAS1) repeats
MKKRYKMRNKIILYSFLIFGFATLLFSCDKREQFINYPAGITDNVSEIAQKQGLNVFAAAIKAAKMDTAFDYLGQYTIFAPTDAAFNAAGITTSSLGSIPEAALRTIVRNHILPGRTTSFSFLPGPNATYGNINRDFVYATTYLSTTAGVGAFAGVYFNGVKILNTDFLANNGVIHIIDGILLPPAGNLTATIALNPNLTYLAAAITTAGLASTLNNGTAAITLLAPDNAAFIAAGYPTIASITSASPTTLSAILRLHVIPAASVPSSVGNGRLFTPDFRVGNYLSLNGNIATTISGTTAGFRGLSNTSDATISSGNILFRTFLSTGAPSVMHVINKVLIP